jgi:hypothetical protein
MSINHGSTTSTINKDVHGLKIFKKKLILLKNADFCDFQTPKTAIFEKDST